MVSFNKIDLISHINRAEDRNEIRKIIDKLEIVLRDHSVESTDFLNPHEINLAISVLNRFKDEISYTISGGHDYAESSIIYIYQSYQQDIDFNDIVIFRFESDEKIKHGDVLGSLIGLSIDRRKIGDILVGKKFTYFFVKREIANFVEINLNKISKYNINLELTNSEDELDLPEKEYNFKKIIANSFRLDNLIAKIFNLSRSNVKKYISQELVKVNFSVETRPHFELEEGDLVSVRRYGRFRVFEVKGNTKKGNFVIEIRLNK
ncbi:RNA-binding protein [Peptoniphilus sp. MSJ-1]|uniref:RNA-binding protein n=1 Tax=Peptoniphilus ovalis TaxID=2841503 RepID=A0ABS6FGF4_9FIRM|nr:YlmH/Sll1252 family protein [Peptoniphilus ovalis]MBU5669041.1 RNA-binding protein [Peptoniphilus ovalis]